MSDTFVAGKTQLVIWWIAMRKGYRHYRKQM